MNLVPWQEFWKSREGQVREALQQYRASGYGKVYLGESPTYRQQPDRADRYCQVAMGWERGWGLGGRQHMLTLYYIVRPMLNSGEIVKVGVLPDGDKGYLVIGRQSV